MRLFKFKPRYWDYPTLPAGESYDVHPWRISKGKHDELLSAAEDVLLDRKLVVSSGARRMGKEAARQKILAKYSGVAHESRSDYPPREVTWEQIKNRRWSREEVIEIARIARIILPSDYSPPKPPSEPEMSKALVKSHRGRGAYQSDRDGKTLAKPADLENIVRQLKVLGIPFLMVTVKSAGMSGTHGWCNGSNWGRTILEELARCAELNFRQEMEKCGGADRRPTNEKPYSGKIPGDYLDANSPEMRKHLR